MMALDIKNKLNFKPCVGLTLLFLSSLLFIHLFAEASNTSSENHQQAAQYFDNDAEIKIPVYWKFSPKDDKRFADPNFDDSAWDTLNINMQLDASPDIDKKFSGKGWFRTWLKVDSVYRDNPLALQLVHFGASEIYLDGQLFYKYGKVGSNLQEEEAYYANLPLIFQLKDSTYHLIAIRYSNQRFKIFQSYLNEQFAGFSIEVFPNPVDISNQCVKLYRLISYALIPLFSITLALGLVHLLLFLFYKKLKQNLYYSIFTLALSFVFFNFWLDFNTTSPWIRLLIDHFTIKIALITCELTLLIFLHNLFKPSFHKTAFTIGSILSFVLLIVIFIPGLEGIVFNSNTLWIILALFTCIESIRSIAIGVIQKRVGARIIGGGVLFFIFTLLGLLLFALLPGQSHKLSFSFDDINMIVISIMFLVVLSIPISMSVFLAFNFSLTNKNLENKLVEVETLSGRTIEQEKEKQDILAKQKETLEIQVQERTSEVVKQKEIIQEKNKDITDSINYAKRIQGAMLPNRKEISASFPQSLLLFKPKDIVSGDFYFFNKNDETAFIAAADCTGHGVPGAFMSIICASKLNDAVSTSSDNSVILSQLNRGVKGALKQSEQDDSATRDGMDIALCVLDTKSLLIKYAGANRPLWIVRKGQANIEEVKATKKAIGGFTEDSQQYETHHIQLERGDTFYIFTDGYADSFGGSENKKLTTKRFKEIILSIQDKTMQEQESYLDTFIENWKADIEQIDDILVIGVRV